MNKNEKKLRDLGFIFVLAECVLVFFVKKDWDSERQRNNYVIDSDWRSLDDVISNLNKFFPTDTDAEKRIDELLKNIVV
jgi:hypothetical protein